jgi:hypothetical protein
VTSLHDPFNVAQLMAARTALLGWDKLLLFRSCFFHIHVPASLSLSFFPSTHLKHNSDEQRIVGLVTRMARVGV